LLIGIVLLMSILHGFRIGLIRTVFAIAGTAAGLVTAIKYYAAGSRMLLDYISPPQFIADTLSFVIIFSLTVLGFHLLSLLILTITRFKSIRIADRLGGIISGLLMGLLICGVILLMLSAFPIYEQFQEHVDQSAIAPHILDTSRVVYEALYKRLPLNLPQLAFHPEEIGSLFENVMNYREHGAINFESLEGSTCFVCGEPVKFLGYLNNQTGSVSPKFICTGCGRTSDGCQTYEGYHLMYKQCPVILGNQGYRFDCGIWTNNSYYRPTGTCPVCGAN